MLIFLIKSNINIYIAGDKTMKRLLLIICALCVSQTVFAALDRDYFDYTQSPEYQAIPVDTSEAAKNTGSETTEAKTVTTTKVVKKTTKGKKRVRFGNEGSSWVNTYWNFGQPNYGETGRF